MQQNPFHPKFILGALLMGALIIPIPLFAAVIDTTSPTITPIADVNLDATGPIVTPVMTPDITATDVIVNDGIDFHFVPDSTVGPLIPGQYTIDWTATDLGLNTDSFTQTVNVRPVINLAPNQTVGEGGTAVVTAYLSGTAPDSAYPITIPYTVTNGNGATAADHGAADGNITFNAGDTTTSISFAIVKDAISDAGETITITLGALPSDVIAGYITDHTVTISETDMAPLAQLRVAQGSNDPTRIITTDGGQVTVNANVTDANGDAPFYDWSASDNALVPLTGTTDSSFTFDPTEMVSGFYFVRLTVSDTGGLSSSYDLLLALVDSGSITLSSDNDSDDDKTDDATEGYDDVDNDGIPDYLDANSNPSLMQGFEPYVYDRDLVAGNTLVNGSITLDWSISTTASNLIVYPLMIATEPGLTLSLGPTAFADGKSYARMSTSDAERLRGTSFADGLVSGDGQVVDIEIGNLSLAGGTANVVIPQIAPIPASSSGNPQFMLFNQLKQWGTFDTSGGDTIKTSTKISNSEYCPGLDDTSPYAATTDMTGEECLFIQIKDGGPNDYDGVANGVIRLMGGVFINSSSGGTTTVEEGGIFSGDSSATSESLNKLDLGTGKGGGTLDYLTLAALFGMLLWSGFFSKPARRRNAV